MTPAPSRKPIPADLQARLTKFFVTNLPDRCSGADVAAAIRGMRTIFDIYIARRRDKEGKRFGFVSMIDVKDRAELIKNLCSIRLGEYKLKFNVARFVLEDGEIQQPKLVREIKNSKVFGSQGSVGDPAVRKEGVTNCMSYKEAFCRGGEWQAC